MIPVILTQFILTQSACSRRAIRFRFQVTRSAAASPKLGRPACAGLGRRRGPPASVDPCRPRADDEQNPNNVLATADS
jgi:hypothetical protein